MSIDKVRFFYSRNSELTDKLFYKADIRALIFYIYSVYSN